MGTGLRPSKSTVCPTCGGLASFRAVTFTDLDSNQLEARRQSGRFLQNFKTGKIIPHAEIHNQLMAFLLNSPSTPLRSHYHNCSEKHSLFLFPLTEWMKHSPTPSPAHSPPPPKKISRVLQQDFQRLKLQIFTEIPAELKLLKSLCVCRSVLLFSFFPSQQKCNAWVLPDHEMAGQNGLLVNWRTEMKDPKIKSQLIKGKCTFACAVH